MLRARRRVVADGLTIVRFFLGLMLVWLSVWGIRALAVATGVVWACWATDVLDGPIARRSPGHPSWVGRHDLVADVTVAAGAWVYLTGAGCVPLSVAVGYALLVAAIWWWSQSPYVGWGAQAIPYAAMLWVALRWVRWLGVFLVGWLLLVVVVTWPRFPHKTAEFLRGMKALFR